MEVQKVKDTYFKLKQERELVSSVELPWVIKVALPYLNELVDGKDKITDSERDTFYKSLSDLTAIVSESGEQANSIKNDRYLTSNSKVNLLEDLTKQRTKQAFETNEKLKKSIGILEKIKSISNEADQEFKNVSDKAYGVFGEPNTIFSTISSEVTIAIKNISADKYVFGMTLGTLEETIEDATGVMWYRKPKSSLQVRQDPNKSHEYHYAINRWVEQHYPNLIGDPTSYEYKQMFNREGAKHHLTGDEFKVKIYLDYVEWKEQELINQRLKEDLFTQKIDEVPKQDTLVGRLKKALRLA
ncbi:hypothetical protein [Streptococcus pluranimalium]|uniref:hypothetical protein n=1 Tax=Streptococcus pluranimalium TaxID=82348 RepID=UPI003F68DFFA